MKNDNPCKTSKKVLTFQCAQYIINVRTEKR
nr:MAG TPA: hypothetical protein [Caudoviricetes sp.]